MLERLGVTSGPAPVATGHGDSVQSQKIDVSVAYITPIRKLMRQFVFVTPGLGIGSISVCYMI